MILSFSIAKMLPYIRAGIRQAHGETVNERVKRQTIRKWGPQAERVLKHPTFPYDLDLWWKVRTPEREFLGGVEANLANAFPVLIEHASTKAIPTLIRITFKNSASHFTSDFSYADGFDSPEDFRDYFVPNVGDVFKGILYRW